MARLCVCVCVCVGGIYSSSVICKKRVFRREVRARWLLWRVRDEEFYTDYPQL